MKAIALHSVVPVRTEPRESAEQETQMLFGELCTIEEHTNNEQGTAPQWYRVTLEADKEEGWVDAKMVSPIGGKDYSSYKKALHNAACIVMPMAYAVSDNNGQTIPLSAGTRLTGYREGHFEVLGVGFRIDPSMVAVRPPELTRENLLQVVRFFLNVPYLWGGKNAMGMDCSGFTQVIMSLFGKALLRNASEQATQGRKISDLKKVQAGDLVFFDHEDGKISHVGIAIDSERVIHCSGRVKVEKLDRNPSGEMCILSAEGHYTHHLVSIRRI
jgi:hypothetical protein